MSIKKIVLFFGTVVLFLGTTAQAKTTDSLVTDLRLRLGQTDSTNSQWTNGQLRRCLNMAQAIIAPYSGGLQKLDTIPGGNIRITTSNGLNSDFIAIKSTSWLWRLGKENKTIPYVPVDSFYRMIKRNDLQVTGDNYTITEDAGGLSVMPQLKSTDSLLISYYAYPAQLDTTYECDFDLGWEEVLVLAAAAIAYEYVEDYNKAAFYVAERDKNIEALRVMTTRRPQSGAVP